MGNFSKAGETGARNWRKFSSKFLYLYVDEQYMSYMTSTRNSRNLLENLCKFIACVSAVKMGVYMRKAVVNYYTFCCVCD